MSQRVICRTGWYGDWFCNGPLQGPTLVSAPDPPCTSNKKKRKESAEEGLVQLIQNNLQSAEFQRVESDWLIGN